MTGRPKLRAMVSELERRKAEQYEGDADLMSNLEFVALYVEGGGTILKLAMDVLREIDSDLRPEALNSYLYATWPDDAGNRLKRARMIGAHALVEHATLIVDKADATDKDKLKKAEMRSRVRHWQAERDNRDELGATPTMAVNVINQPTLHLDSLRRLSPRGEAPSTLAGASTHAVSDQPDWEENQRLLDRPLQKVSQGQSRA